MSSTKLDSQDLLSYNSRYGVLICRSCQYAIQKSALESHLLRHKIYRSDRQQLLAYISQLEIFEPKDVPLPTCDSPPVEHLPVLDGYRCAEGGCKILCASWKRMRRHQSELHGRKENSTAEEYACPVKLQTFFLGTKIRYFEVAPSSDIEVANTEREADVTSPPGRMLSSSPHYIDLETLTYFHLFTTKTSLALPCTDPLHEGHSYWQTDAVTLALRHRWLMYGLLALSAYHSATIADDTASQRPDYKRAVAFCKDFDIGWEDKLRDIGPSITQEQDETMTLGQKIRCLRRCARWTFAGSLLDHDNLEPVVSFRVQNLVDTIRDLMSIGIAASSGGVQSDDGDGQNLVTRSGLVPRTRTFSETNAFDLLQALPSHMAEVFGKPTTAQAVQDVFATLSAIMMLIERYETSFSSEGVGATWQSMATWVTKLPERFICMVESCKPAALVVVAYWAVLVKRAEDSGCWYLKGVAERIIAEIKEDLSRENQQVQSLISGLVLWRSDVRSQIEGEETRLNASTVDPTRHAKPRSQKRNIDQAHSRSKRVRVP